MRGQPIFSASHGHEPDALQLEKVAAYYSLNSSDEAAFRERATLAVLMAEDGSDANARSPDWHATTCHAGGYAATNGTERSLQGWRDFR